MAVVMVEEIRRWRSRIGTGRCAVASQVQSNPRSDSGRLLFARKASGQLFPVVHHVGQPVIGIQNGAVRRTEGRNGNGHIIRLYTKDKKKR